PFWLRHSWLQGARPPRMPIARPIGRAAAGVAAAAAWQFCGRRCFWRAGPAGARRVAMAAPLRVIVTGGSSGIGRALVAKLAARGHQVYATGRDAKALRGLESLGVSEAASGAKVRASAGDVSCEADVERQFKEAAEFFGGPPDVLVANAGCGAGRQDFEEVPAEQFDRVMSTNVRGVFLWVQRVVGPMKRQGRGQVVVTSSMAAVKPCPRAAVYAASKAAVQAMVLSLRAELKGTGVKVGTVNPGAVATEWWGDAGRGGWTEEMAPQGQPFWTEMLRPEDVADGVLSLVFQKASSNIESLYMDPADSGGAAPPAAPGCPAKRPRTD
ncbi:unnamed protein product, partial [Prorocentrum cordatum]